MYTKQDILKQLNDMRAPKSSIVLMHSSLRSIGEVEGGAEALLDTLIEYFTEDGGIFCMPTHTWHKLGLDEITLDMTKAESCVGALSVVAINHRRGIRTENPTHSMVVFGDYDKVQEFIKEEGRVTTPTAPEGCYGKLYSQGGFILLVGVCQNKNTYLHSVGQMLSLPNRMDEKADKVTVKKPSGEVLEKNFTLYYTDYTDDISLRFVKYETAFRYHKAIKDGFIGNAPTQLCDAVKLYDTIKLIYSNSNGEDPLKDEKPINPKWYCK